MTLRDREEERHIHELAEREKRQADMDKYGGHEPDRPFEWCPLCGTEMYFIRPGYSDEECWWKCPECGYEAS